MPALRQVKPWYAAIEDPVWVMNFPMTDEMNSLR